MSPNINVVIIGGGIIGCTTAYYLTHHPSFSPTHSITLIEASTNGVAQGASGKAGGLVAKWAFPTELVNVSFREHVRLAEEHGGKERWGWRFVGCGNWEGRGESIGTSVGGGEEGKNLEKTLGLDERRRTTVSRKSKGLPDDLQWVTEELTEEYSSLAPDGDTAQVHPYLFTTSMFALAQAKGLRFISGRAIAIEESHGQVTGVTYTHNVNDVQETADVPATHVIVAGGPWSPTLIPKLPISGSRAHSITIHPPPDSTIAPYVLFTSIIIPPSRKPVTPEIYSRPGPLQEVYACGPVDNSRLPPCVDDVEVDQDACDSILKHVCSISKELREGTVHARQACFLPVVSSGGGPIVGEVAKGLIVATGHTCWVSWTLDLIFRAFSRLPRGSAMLPEPQKL
jgi:glycine/D-amino acid oxidase-like deaminating enzyme